MHWGVSVSKALCDSVKKLYIQVQCNTYTYMNIAPYQGKLYPHATQLRLTIYIHLKNMLDGVFNYKRHIGLSIFV